MQPSDFENETPITIHAIPICGSMQFLEKKLRIQSDLNNKGYRIFLPEAEESEACYSSLPPDKKPAIKQKFIDAHLDKIRNLDAILVANFEKCGVGGYVGANTLMEMAFAYVLKKPILLLKPMAPQPCKDEVDGLAVIHLHGDFQNLLHHFPRK